MSSKRAPIDLEPWQFFGWGSSRLVLWGDQQQSKQQELKEKQNHGAHSLVNQWMATAIVGNDLLSSCLYVIGLTFASAGPLAPVCLVITAAMLYLFRWVYTEAVGALPIDGGAYTILLNSTSKAVAASAACLTLLSYVATAVVSATDAVIYLQSVWPELTEIVGVLFLLALFCGLAILGVGESAAVASCMLSLHMATLLLVAIIGIIHMANDKGKTFSDNWKSPFPDILAGDGDDQTPGNGTLNAALHGSFAPSPSASASDEGSLLGSLGDTARVIARGNVATALFFGFGQSLLGVSGFESTANMVQAMQPGAFPLVLRNLWLAVAIVNPVLALVCMGVLPMDTIYARSADVVVAVGQAASGGSLAPGASPTWLGYLVSIDAFIVLSGGTLTSFIGVQGLVARMSMDKCLPEFLIQTNSCRGTAHWIPISFALIAASLCLILNGDVDTLSGVYTLSFLSVMCLFAIGNGLLRYKRPSLRRPLKAARGTIAAALVFALLGLLANVIMKPSAVQYFVIYFSCTGMVVLVMFFRTQVMQLMLPVVRSCSKRLSDCCPGCCGLPGRDSSVGHATPLLGDAVDDAGSCLTAAIRSAREEPVIYLAKRPDLPALNKAILYIRANENTQNVVIAHFMEHQVDAHAGNGGRSAKHGSETKAADESSSSDAGSVEVRLSAPQAKNRFAADQLIPESDLTGQASDLSPGETVQLEGPAAILQEQVMVLDALYPKIKIDFLCISGTVFCPDALAWLADYVDVSINSVFIGAPDSDFAHAVSALGGVRVITKPTRDIVHQKFRIDEEPLEDDDGHKNAQDSKQAVASQTQVVSIPKAESDGISMSSTKEDKKGTLSSAAGGAAAASSANPTMFDALVSASKPKSSFRRTVSFAVGSDSTGDQELVDGAAASAAASAAVQTARSRSMPGAELDQVVDSIGERAAGRSGFRRMQRAKSYGHPSGMARLSSGELDAGPSFAGSLPLSPPPLGRSMREGGTGLVPLLLYGSSRDGAAQGGLRQRRQRLVVQREPVQQAGGVRVAGELGGPAGASRPDGEGSGSGSGAPVDGK